MAGSGHSHTIHSVGSQHAAPFWDNEAMPVLEIESSETVELECADASGVQLNAQPAAADLESLDLRRVNPVTGPVHVDGAQPGDVLAVEILEPTPKGVVGAFLPAEIFTP